MNDTSILLPILTNCRTIQVKGLENALVDEIDFNELALGSRNWHRHGGRPECGAYVGSGKIYLHRVILGLTRGDGLQGDHKNLDRRDNRRDNLRVCTPLQNMANAPSTYRCPTGFKGVFAAHTPPGKWAARLRTNRVSGYFGQYATPIEAAFAYDCATLAINGDFARPNGVTLDDPSREAEILATVGRHLAKRGFVTLTS